MDREENANSINPDFVLETIYSQRTSLIVVSQ